MSSIKLSKEYGANPSIQKCFFCGRDKGIVLFGHLGGRGRDLEAPKSCVMDYEPCEECKADMRLGVALIEVSNEMPEDERPPIKTKGGENVYPLGRMLVIKSEAWSKIVGQEYNDGSTCFVDSEIIDDIMSCKNQQEEQEEGESVKRCPVSNEPVLYLDCQECDDKLCECTVENSVDNVENIQTPKEPLNMNELLQVELLAHRGHNVSIVSYGDENNPASVCLECEDCGMVILDAGIHTICARED